MMLSDRGMHPPHRQGLQGPQPHLTIHRWKPCKASCRFMHAMCALAKVRLCLRPLQMQTPLMSACIR